MNFLIICYKKILNNNNLFLLLSLLVLIFTYKYNLIKFPEAINGPLMYWDGNRYSGPNSFKEILEHEKFNSFPFYFLFIGIFKYLNIVDHLPISQFIIFHFSCFYLYKKMSKIYNADISFICWILISLNPIFFKWCHAVNPLIITISLSILSLSFLLSKKNKTLITFLILVLLLKNDAKLILNYVLISYFYFVKIFRSENNKIFLILLIITILISIHHLLILNSSTQVAFILPDASLGGKELLKQGASFIYFTDEIIKDCSITQNNSLKNHLCMIVNYPVYSIELYSTRLLYGLFWISPFWSLQYQIISKVMLFFYYFFLFFGLKKNEHSIFFLINFVSPFILTLPYILDGDQRFVTHAYIFLTPLSATGFYYFLKKYLYN